MESFCQILLAFTLIAAALATFILKRPPATPRNLPPGPKPWPIIGNLHLIGSYPHKSLHQLSQKYGEIMLLKFGKTPIIVASSAETAKLFLKTHDANFVSRPSLAAGKYTGYNWSNMTWAPYGPYWLQARRIFGSEVFSSKSLQLFEPVRGQGRRSLLSRLYSLSGKPVVLRPHLLHFTLSNISRMVLGNNYFRGENDIFKIGEVHGLLDEWFLLNGVVNIGDWIPWLQFFDVQGYVKRMKDLAKKLDRFNEFVMDDHEARRAAEKEGFVAKDVVDILLAWAEKDDLEVELTRDGIKALFQDLLAGGTDTSATTIEWSILEVLRNPRVAEKAKEELDRVIGKSRLVEEDDISQLPYINAIVKESLRLHPVSPLLPPHYAINDCHVAGYDIPKGTSVIVNTWSIGRDPNSWDSPEEFLPERFMTKNVDVEGNDFSLLPFGSGRRRCPGYKLGLKIVRTTLASLLHGFEFRLVEGMGVEDICVEDLYGLTTHPKESLQVIMKPILPPHLYHVENESRLE